MNQKSSSKTQELWDSDFSKKAIGFIWGAVFLISGTITMGVKLPSLLYLAGIGGILGISLGFTIATYPVRVIKECLLFPLNQQSLIKTSPHTCIQFYQSLGGILIMSSLIVGFIEIVSLQAFLGSQVFGEGLAFVMLPMIMAFTLKFFFTDPCRNLAIYHQSNIKKYRAISRPWYQAVIGWVVLLASIGTLINYNEIPLLHLLSIPASLTLLIGTWAFLLLSFRSQSSEPILFLLFGKESTRSKTHLRNSIKLDSMASATISLTLIGMCSFLIPAANEAALTDFWKDKFYDAILLGLYGSMCYLVLRNLAETNGVKSGRVSRKLKNPELILTGGIFLILTGFITSLIAKI